MLSLRLRHRSLRLRHRSLGLLKLGLALLKLGLALLDRGERLGVLVDGFLDVKHGVADCADSVVLLVEAARKPDDFRNGHAG